MAKYTVYGNYIFPCVWVNMKLIHRKKLFKWH